MGHQLDEFAGQLFGNTSGRQQPLWVFFYKIKGYFEYIYPPWSSSAGM